MGIDIHITVPHNVTAVSRRRSFAPSKLICALTQGRRSPDPRIR